MKNRRVILVALAGLFAVTSMASYLYFWRTRPIGSGPAGPAVSSAIFGKVWSEQRVLLVGIGDSVTAGFGARKGYSYFDRLIKNPRDEFREMRGKCLQAVFPNLQFTNLAISGSTSAEHITRQLPKVPKADSNTVGLILITTGGNDLIHNYGRTPPREEAMFGATWKQAAPWVKNFETRLQSIVKQAHARFPAGCHIFLVTIYDPTDGAGDSERAGLPKWKDGQKILAAYNEVIVRCSKENSFVHIVDIHRAFLGHGIHCTQFWTPHYDSKDPHYWYYENLEDPNERRYDVIRRLFLTEMARIFRGLTD